MKGGYMGRKNNLPWYTIPILNTILGALSIIIYFGVYLYGDKGFAFWAVIICWAAIIISTNIEVSRLYVNQKKFMENTTDEVNKLKEEIAKLKK
jgi:uncharacterized membrane protein (DUF106 family)